MVALNDELYSTCVNCGLEIIKCGMNHGAPDNPCCGWFHQDALEHMCKETLTYATPINVLKGNPVEIILDNG